MNLQLENKLALVSGSTAGIGFAIAKALAAEDSRVIVNGRTEARVRQAIASIRADIPSAKLEELALDLSKADGAAETTKRYPDVDILVNNLGVYQVRDFAQITDAEWSAIIETNFLSGVRLSRHYLPRMKAAGWGRIIFISSESAVNIPVEMIHYGVTKTMQVALARGLAETTAGTAVTVNSVLPGPTLSEGVESMLDEVAKKAGQSIEEAAVAFVKAHRSSSILQRTATADEVANMVVYACSPQASATTGAALRVDGGVIDTIA